MVYDELEMLQRMRHAHIVKFVDWFESKVNVRFSEEMLQLTINCRTNTTSLPSSLQEENCSTGSVSRGDSRRRTPHRRSDRFWRRVSIVTTTMGAREASKTFPYFMSDG